MSYYLGLMSGTSMDGIDAAIIDLPKQQLIAGATIPYPSTLKQRINTLIEANTVSLQTYHQLHRDLGEAFALAANSLIQESKLDKSLIKAIGSHGQTIVHAPEARPSYTVQLGCGHTIAARTGVSVVADFRTKDLVLGGQGAPLAPVYHAALLAQVPKPLLLLNLGGIANLTCLGSKGEVLGYDVAPGNGLLDAWMQTAFHRPYDDGGRIALAGNVIPELLSACLSDPFFKAKGPKSLDKSYFSLAWLRDKMRRQYAAEDVQATLVELTATAISQAVLNEETVSRMLICGGGVHNQALMSALSRLLPSLRVESTAAEEINPDYLEAMMCAWLAAQCINRQPLPLQAVTGGAEAILGCIYPAR